MVVLLASAGCGPAHPVASPPSSLSEAPPNEVSGLEIPPGRIDDAIAKVDGLVGDLMKNTGIPGLAVAIVRGGKTLYAKGFGVRTRAKATLKTTRSMPTRSSSSRRCRNRSAPR